MLNTQDYRIIFFLQKLHLSVCVPELGGHGGKSSNLDCSQNWQCPRFLQLLEITSCISKKIAETLGWEIKFSCILWQFKFFRKISLSPFNYQCLKGREVYKKKNKEKEYTLAAIILHPSAKQTLVISGINGWKTQWNVTKAGKSICKAIILFRVCSFLPWFNESFA